MVSRAFATQYIGVYNADAGLVGEARYLVGSMLGTVHCALCDITHSPVRRKRQWDQMVAQLTVPFLLYHLNDAPADVGAVVAQRGSPIVLARLADGALVTLLGPQTLDSLGGAVDLFHRALLESARRLSAGDSPTAHPG